MSVHFLYFCFFEKYLRERRFYTLRRVKNILDPALAVRYTARTAPGGGMFERRRRAYTTLTVDYCYYSHCFGRRQKVMGRSKCDLSMGENDRKFERRSRCGSWAYRTGKRRRPPVAFLPNRYGYGSVRTFRKRRSRLCPRRIFFLFRV